MTDKIDKQIEKLNEQLSSINDKAEKVKKQIKEKKSKKAKEAAKIKRARDDYRKYTAGGFFLKLLASDEQFREQYQAMFFDSMLPHQRKRFGLPPKDENAVETAASETAKTAETEVA